MTKTFLGTFRHYYEVKKDKTPRAMPIWTQVFSSYNRIVSDSIFIFVMFRLCSFCSSLTSTPFVARRTTVATEKYNKLFSIWRLQYTFSTNIIGPHFLWETFLLLRKMFKKFQSGYISKHDPWIVVFYLYLYLL